MDSHLLLSLIQSIEASVHILLSLAQDDDAAELHASSPQAALLMEIHPLLRQVMLEVLECYLAGDLSAASPFKIIQPALGRLLALWLCHETDLDEPVMRKLVQAIPSLLRADDSLLVLFLFPLTLLTMEPSFRRAFVDHGGVKRLEHLSRLKKSSFSLVKEIFANCSISSIQ